MSDVVTKACVDNLAEAQEATSLMNFTVRRLEQRLKDAVCEVDEYRRAIVNLEAKIQRLEDCAEFAWGIIANVSGGNWAEQRADWRKAATRWRDERFHPELSECKAKEAKP